MLCNERSGTDLPVAGKSVQLKNHSDIDTGHENQYIPIKRELFLLTIHVGQQHCMCLCQNGMDRGQLVWKLLSSVYTQLIPLTDLRTHTCEHTQNGHYCLYQHYIDGGKGRLQRWRMRGRQMGCEGEKLSKRAQDELFQKKKWKCRLLHKYNYFHWEILKVIIWVALLALYGIEKKATKWSFPHTHTQTSTPPDTALVEPEVGN